MKPSDCKNYRNCNAPVCPFHSEWRQCQHLDGERVCHWLSEYSKQGGPARVRGGLQAEHGEAVAEIHAAIVASPGLLSRRLARASHTGSRIAAGEKLHRPTIVRGVAPWLTFEFP